MAVTNRYNRLQQDIQSVEKGYGNIAFLAALEEFETVAMPSTTPVNQEDILTITTDHTFLTNTPPYGFTKLWSRPKDNQAAATGQGDIGTLTVQHTHTLFVPGDDPALLAMIKKNLNKELILLVQDVGTGKMIQYGNAITPAYFQAPAFSSGNQLGEGEKGYKFDFVAMVKYWYEGVITQQA